MSYPQFGYPYNPAASQLGTSQDPEWDRYFSAPGYRHGSRERRKLLVPGTSLSSSLQSASPSGISALSPTSSDPPGASPPTQSPTMYSSSLLSTYPRVAGLTDGVYTSAYAAQGYVPFGTDPSAFYSPLNAENSDAWRGLSSTAAWPYDPTMGGYPYGTSYGGLDVRRKNATRESTSTLKAWLYEHIKNPYPTKGEKIMLAIITKMTLTQVSTWFANARRRLKKENKMQWSPRNRNGDDEDGGKSDDDDDNENGDKDLKSDSDDVGKGDDDSLKDGLGGGSLNLSKTAADLCGGDRDHPDLHGNRSRDDDEDIIVDGGDLDRTRDSFDLKTDASLSRLSTPLGSPDHSLTDSLLSPPPRAPACSTLNGSNLDLSRPLHGMLGGGGLGGLLGNNHPHKLCGVGIGGGTDSNSPVGGGVVTQEKPRIWSLADVATSSTPPPGRRSPLSMLGGPGVLSTGPQHMGGGGGGGGLGGGLGGMHRPGQGATAFSAPHSSHSFQPWVNGTYHNTVCGGGGGGVVGGGCVPGGGGVGHTAAGLASYTYPLSHHHGLHAAGGGGGTSQMGVVHSAPHRPTAADPLAPSSLGGLGGLTSASPYANKLTNGFLGDKSSLSQLAGFSHPSGDTQTAFKPVPKRL